MPNLNHQISLLISFASLENRTHGQTVKVVQLEDASWVSAGCQVIQLKLVLEGSYGIDEDVGSLFDRLS